MFGLSFTHLVLLAIIMLVFIGPEQLPDVARTFARLLNEWKRASSDIQSSLTNTLKNDFDLNKMVDPKLDQKYAEADPKIVNDPPTPAAPPVNSGNPPDGEGSGHQ